MARRRRRSGKHGADTSYIYILQIAAVLVIVITPVILFFGALYFGLKRKSLTGEIQGELSDFWLDDDEKEEFSETAKALTDARNAIADAQTAGRLKKVAVNKDGSFSARSNLGKELRGIVEENEMVIGRLAGIHSELSDLPQKRWYNFRSVYTASRAFLSGIAAWLILAGVSPAVFLQGRYAEGFYIFFHIPAMVFKGVPISAEVWQMMFAVTGGSVLAAAFVAVVSLFSVKKVTPFPPKVTEKNLYNF